MTRWTASDVKKAQRTLVDGGAIPKDYAEKHVENTVKLLGLTPDTPPETLVRLVQLYYDARALDRKMSTVEAAQEAHRLLLEEQMKDTLKDEVVVKDLEEIPMSAGTTENAKEIHTQLPEAPASATVRVTSSSGFGWLVTLRDFTVKGVLEKIEFMEDWFLRNEWAPEGVTQHAAPGQPACPTHGKSKESKHGGWFCPEKIVDDDGTGKPVYCKWKAE